MRPRTSALQAVALWILGVSFVSAQTVHDQTVREKVSVEVITVRLTARDLSGKRVEDLKASDLALTVDGKPVAIETFSGPELAAIEAREAAHAPGPAMATTPGVGDVPVRTMILVDVPGTHPFERKDACAELNRFLRASGPGHREFLVALFDGRRVEMETGWTSDAEAASSALQRIGTGSTLHSIESPGTVAGSTGPTGTSSGTWLQIAKERFHEALLEALAVFPHSPGQGRLLVVSGGTSLMRPQDLNSILACQITPSERARLLASAGDVGAAHAREIERATFALWSRAVNPVGDALTSSDVVAKAIERDILLIPVQAEALDRGDFDLSGSQADLKQAFRAASPNGAVDGRVSAHLATGQAMTELAESTGAEAILVSRKASDRLSEIGSRATYTLSFRDSSSDHRYHQIDLKCGRPGVKIEYRRGFRIPHEDERTLDTVVAGFLQARSGSDPMAVAVVPSASTDSRGRAATKLDISFAPPRETSPSDVRAIEVVAVGEDRNGNRTEPVEWSGTALRAEDEDAYQAGVLLSVPPGYAWSVAVRDQPTGLTSYVFVPASPGR